jgi:LacI family transcriptional regulator
VAKLLARRDRPTCILLPNDTTYFGAQEAIREQELRIPRDISLAGYDGISLTQTLRPQLTTIRQNSEALGEQAAKLLIMRLEQPETAVEEVVTIPVELIKGSTVGWCDVW